MTKQEMIDIILEESDFLWNELQSSTELYGYNSEPSNAIRNQWYAIDRLIKRLKLLTL